MSMALRRGSPFRVVSGEYMATAQGQPAERLSVTAKGVSEGAMPTGRRRGFLVVDPQALVRHGLALTLSSLHDGAQSWQCGTPAEALDLLQQGTVNPDVVLMDADGLPDDRTASVVDFLSALSGIPAIIMSAAFSAAETRTFLAAGAVCCLLKSDPTAVLADAVALALTREGYVQLPYGLIAQSSPVKLPDGGLDQTAVARLTNRQRDIFRLLQQGCSNKEIARQLGVLEGTVKVHVRAMMQKLGARNRTQIAILAARCDISAN
ncbi:MULTISPECIES: LuxR C-terminal-related transcriptional regulator [unclassified Azospirillum]|jgi:DNA-binding NarL/FixJ family response regulator|uniref:response regulator transcription factor n=1 Tax=unclassified Azospirillum TaxID=2630922 RepID=UPI000B6713B8|nr:MULTISPECIES: response regulator transcription factor [unclassified Azospirillum]SNR95929.1 DNA-binding response regulator, NarL/FixJ family, contains REC and HTH domains [Azospirillum sp. RU38E]SNS12585.1 DNA-binding response regulator, NarL/FixJ family, contains REC and HTH domains [Azospirillum sp. RU37A]